MELTICGRVDFEEQDSGMSFIGEVVDEVAGHSDDHPFVRLCSCNDSRHHDLLRPFDGKRVEITVKLLED